MSVMALVRGFLGELPAVGFGRVALANGTLSSDTASSLPERSTRTSTGLASGPFPRDTDRYALPEAGVTAKSAIVIDWGVVPRREAIFSLIPSTFSGPPAESAWVSAVSTAKIAAPCVSARKSSPFGPNANGPADFQSGDPFDSSAAHAGPPTITIAARAVETIR